MVDQLTFILQQYPWLQHVIAIMAICRIVFKPLFQILGKYVELTVNEDDNKKLSNFMNTKTYKMIVFIVDLVASVKLPKVKRKK